MKMLKNLILRPALGCGLGILALVALASEGEATPLIDFETAVSSSSIPDYGLTLGYSFDVTSAVTIDALGVFDAGSDGLAGTHEVGLWTSAGASLASTSVGASSTLFDPSASGAGRYVYSSIGNLTLGVGSYVIGAFYGANTADPVVSIAGSIGSNVAGVSFGSGFSLNGLALARPTDENISNQWFGPAMRVAAVPVPAALPLFGTGLAIAGLAGWRRKRKAAAV